MEDLIAYLVRMIDIWMLLMNASAVKFLECISIQKVYVEIFVVMVNVIMKIYAMTVTKEVVMVAILTANKNPITIAEVVTLARKINAIGLLQNLKV